jgi:L-threonylcarbamoyladenylate synthase
VLTISIGKTTSEREAAIRAAVLALKRGEVVAFPTETVYGIGCDPLNVKAVNRIFAIKGRNERKPVQLIAGSMAHVMKIAEINEANAAVMKRWWPGPLTLLLPLKKGLKLAPRVSPRRTIGIRVSGDAFMRALALRFGRPIAATSANRSGHSPATSGRGVVKAFVTDPMPDLLLDAGTIPKRRPTTVARIKGDGGIEVFRQGGVRLSGR